MTMGVFDFKSIRRSLERQEQKAEFEEKNPVTVAAPVVWTPEWGYGTAAVPLAADLAQQLADCYAYASYPRFTAKI